MGSRPGLSALCALAVASGCTSGESPRPSIVQDEVLAQFGTSDKVDVIVNFDDPAPSWSLSDLESHREAIATAREAILAASRGGLVPTRVFAHVPAIAGRLSHSALDVLSRFSGVSLIQTDSAGHGSLAVSVPAIGADVAKRDYHVTGKGVRVAVLDTGINSTHPDLKSSVVATQHCFTHAACPPASNSEGTSAEDDHGHGSHVSGIITSDGTVAGVGFAPDAEIVAVKINDQASSGFVSDWVAGLDWVFSNLATLNVKLLNASISTNRLYGSASECDRSEPALAKAVKNLVDAGVTIFASAGNQGSSATLSAPACNTGAIAVGATYKTNQGRQPTSGTYAGQWGSAFADCADQTTVFDQVACFTNSGPRLDIVAPGAVIISDVLGTKAEAYRGTSQASPTAAGVAALMLECNPKLTPAEIRDILVHTGVPLTDPKNGRSYPSIRATAAVKEACAGQSGVDAGSDAGPRDSAAALDTSLLRDGSDDRRSRDSAIALDTSLLRDGSDDRGSRDAAGAIDGAAGAGGTTRAGGKTGTAGLTTASARVPGLASRGRAGVGESSTSDAWATSGRGCRIGTTPAGHEAALLALATLLGLRFFRRPTSRLPPTPGRNTVPAKHG